MHTETVNTLLMHLQEKDFTGHIEDSEDSLIVIVPKDTFTNTVIANLQKIIDNKSELPLRASLAEKVVPDITEDNIGSAWFPYTIETREVVAYTEFCVGGLILQSCGYSGRGTQLHYQSH